MSSGRLLNVNREVCRGKNAMASSPNYREISDKCWNLNEKKVDRICASMGFFWTSCNPFRLVNSFIVATISEKFDVLCECALFWVWLKLISQVTRKLPPFSRNGRTQDTDKYTFKKQKKNAHKQIRDSIVRSHSLPFVTQGTKHPCHLNCHHNGIYFNDTVDCTFYFHGT